MIPIRDHNPSGKFSFITYLLIGLNVLVLIWMLLISEAHLDGFLSLYALVPIEIVRGNNLTTLVTSIFLHGGIMHLAGNMLFLYIFGDNLEDYFGHFKFLLFYLLSGLAASGAQILVNPLSTIPMVGASGAIAGVMGGYLALFPRHRIDVLFSFGFFLRQATVPAFTMLFYWFVFQLLSGTGGLVLIDEAAGGVAYFAHIGGFAFGWAGTQIFRRIKRDENFLN